MLDNRWRHVDAFLTPCGYLWASIKSFSVRIRCLILFPHIQDTQTCLTHNTHSHTSFWCVCPKNPSKKIFLKQRLFTSCEILLFISEGPPEAVKLHMCVCLCIFIRSKLFHVPTRDFHPQNPPPTPPHYQNPPLSHFLPPPLPCLSQRLAAAGYYWSTLTSIRARWGMSHQKNTHTNSTQTCTIRTNNTHTHTDRLVLSSKWLRPGSKWKGWNKRGERQKRRMRAHP